MHHEGMDVFMLRRGVGGASAMLFARHSSLGLSSASALRMDH
jgi:hypothetical protein